MDKQKELKQEALKRFMLSVFPETNYTTKFYVQNCLTILFNEKNPQVIEKQILELTTNYALALGVAKVYMLKPTPQIKNLNSCYSAYKGRSSTYKSKLLADYKTYEITQNKLRSVSKKRDSLNSKIDTLIQTLPARPISATDEANYKSLASLENQRKSLNNQINRIKIRNDIPFTANETQNPNNIQVPFGMVLDVVSSALSSIDELKKKGFFKQAIDYRNDNFYVDLKASKTSTDIVLKKTLDTLQNHVIDEISPYIKNYELIKEFYSNNFQTKGSASIKNVLVNNYLVLMKGITGNDFAKIITNSLKDTALVTPQVKQVLKAINNYEGYLRSLNQFNIHRKAIQAYIDNYSILQNLQTKAESLYNSINTGHAIVNKEIAQLTDNDIFSDTTLRKSLVKLAATYDSAQIKKDTLNARITSAFKLIDDFRSSLAEVRSSSPFSIKIQQPKDTLQLQIFADSVAKIIQRKQVANADTLVIQGNFFDIYLNNILENFANAKTLAIVTGITDVNKASLEQYTDLISKTYQQLTLFSKQKTVSLNDINYIDQQVIPQMIKFGVIFTKDQDTIKVTIKKFRILSQLIKIKAVLEVGNLKQYESEFMDLFSFISNLGNLDQAETYQTILDLLENANSQVESSLDDGKFKNVYILFSNAIKKYTIINTKDQYIQIDVVSFLTDLQQYSDRNNNTWLGLYLTLGLNQNVFVHPVMLPGSSDYIKYIGFASEKIGLKFRLANFNKLSGYENAVKTDVNLNKRAPFVNQLYAIVYGSGLLYSIANTATSTNFDYPHIGTGVGIRFYNALDVNLVIGFPFIKNEPISRNAFYGIGLDIPLGEYLEKIGQKN